jgi:ABC-type nitrate/sulfonate/bicarbonate transport system substrate-binding protein
VAAGATATFRMTKLYAAAGGESAYTILCKGWEINPQISDVWYATSSWIKSNPDLALAFNIAAVSANRWVKANKQGWIDLAMSKVSGYTQQFGESDYNTLVNTLDDWPANGSLDRSLCDSTLKTSLEFKAIPKPYTTDQLVTFVYQDAAVKILGPQS